jgi:hypothetical protein
MNEGEVSSPASSILYPFLAALFLKIGFGSVGPLLINVAATLAAGVIAFAILARAGYSLVQLPAWRLVGLALITLLSFDLLAVPFTGMEHSLHIVMTLVALLGVQVLLQSNRVTIWLLISAGLCPLIRYEGVALWLGVAGLLIYRRELRAAAVLVVPTAAALCSFSAWLVCQGLPALPNSILAKAGIGGPTGDKALPTSPLQGVIAHFNRNIGSHGYELLLVTTTICAAATIVAWRDRRRSAALFGGLGACISLAHVFVGITGGYGRYEAYAEGTGLLCAAVALAHRLAPALRGARPLWLSVSMVCAIAVLSLSIKAAVYTPIGARNIYDQQYQMHRFVTEYWPYPVGVNDIGEVTYRNTSYVLDLGGLASEAARRGHLNGTNADWMDDLAQQHGVGLVMIYRDWFANVPARWQSIGTLNLAGPRGVIGDRVVTFYATTPAAATKLRPLLASFASTVPAPASVHVLH